jgi:uncharacterized protein YecE (DUF72 family)
MRWGANQILPKSGARDQGAGIRKRKLPNMPRRPRVRIGCAGWSIASQHAALFGPGDSALERYATRFDATEINSSFYRPHQRQTYARWAQSVPSGFRFSVKLPKSISHESRLQRCGTLLDQFMDGIDGLGRKLGGILVQLPPSLMFDARVAAMFFAMMRRRTRTAIACEPRHVTWFSKSADSIMERYAINRVAADPATPCAEAATPGSHGTWRYWRWHGSPRIYYSDYDDASLQKLAERVVAQTPKTGACWVIFDNTAHGFATTNAAQLQALLGQAAPPRRNV